MLSLKGKLHSVVHPKSSQRNVMQQQKVVKKDIIKLKKFMDESDQQKYVQKIGENFTDIFSPRQKNKMRLRNIKNNI